MKREYSLIYLPNSKQELREVLLESFDIIDFIVCKVNSFLYRRKMSTGLYACCIRCQYILKKNIAENIRVCPICHKQFRYKMRFAERLLK